VRALTALLACLAVPCVAGAQTPAPPCPPGVGPSVTVRAHDLESTGGPLTATHTVAVELETSDGRVLDDFKLTPSAGATTVQAGPTPGFRADAPGPVSVIATWLQYDADADADCSASAQGAFVLGPAKPPRFVAPRRGARDISELEWALRVGKTTDLRPVELRLRGVRRARLPGASAPDQTLALGLRSGDPGRMLSGTGRVLRSAGWRFRVGPYYDGEFPIKMYGPQRGGRRRAGFGFELELIQGGRRIGRSRGVGSCEFTSVGPLCRVSRLGAR
jgi:hypothetical protein